MQKFMDSGLEDVHLRTSNGQWTNLTNQLWKNGCHIERAALLLERSSVGRHQLARDWKFQDNFLYNLEGWDVDGNDVLMFVGRTKCSKKNQFQRVEHFGIFRHKDVKQCAWGQWIETLVSLLAFFFFDMNYHLCPN